MLKNLTVLAASVWLLSISKSTAQVQTPRYVQMSEATKAYYEYLPQGFPNSMARYPLILFVHGYGEIGQGTTTSLPLVLRNGIPKLIDNGSFPTSFTSGGQTYRFIVISPQFTGFPSVNDIHNVLNYVTANYPVDINRIYLTGLSMGGGASWYYPGYHSNFAARIAATVPVCGATEVSQTYANNIAYANLPVWATHNSGDPTVSVSITNGLVDLINNRTTPPNPLAKKTIFQTNGHDAWTQTYNPAFKENGLNIYEWMLQFKRNFTVLPVSGLTFTARANGQSVALNWSTAAEAHVAGFQLQYSKDGNEYSNLNYIASQSVNGNGAQYQFTHLLPQDGANFYRIVIIDKDGARTYSEIRQVNIKSGWAAMVNGNPVKDVLQISTNKVAANAQVFIYSMDGKMLMQSKLLPAIPLPAMAKAMYMALIKDDATGEVIRLKFLKD